jgi:hypothetical protein
VSTSAEKTEDRRAGVREGRGRRALHGQGELGDGIDEDGAAWAWGGAEMMVPMCSSLQGLSNPKPGPVEIHADLSEVPRRPRIGGQE